MKNPFKRNSKAHVDMSKESIIGLVGLGVMGQNLALNIAEKGFKISVYNRSPEKVDSCVERAEKEGVQPLVGYKDVGEFVQSLAKPRRVIMLVTAGKAVDATIETLSKHMEAGDLIIDGGNEWYVNTERRAEDLKETGIHYMGMGVSGGEEGARNGPSLMPGGPKDAYKAIEEIVKKVAAQVNDGPCVTHIGPGGAGNYVKMVHNGIEYGDMQLIAETYDILHNIGGMDYEELHNVFSKWNKGRLESFLIEITSKIFTKKDDEEGSDKDYLLDKILDKTGMKGTGKWTVQEAAEKSTAAPTIAGALDARFISGRKDERVKASKSLRGPKDTPKVDVEALVKDMEKALYASKICSYAQGMNLIKAASETHEWDLDLGEISRIWKGGCIIRAVFLDRIKKAYDKDAKLASLLVDPDFAKELNEGQDAWRRIVTLSVQHGIPVPTIGSSLAYFDQYRRDRLPANLVQAQRDFFGAHTFERTDKKGSFHANWY
eukprot:GFYU01011702.1.p1 GENE.GFYU01011702.1~~GFYU01011702.1.p1  ORF type:complete len:489 (-),score=180.32 GFYU01011702.1:111-1577(-)